MTHLFTGLGGALTVAVLFSWLTRQMFAGVLAFGLGFGVFIVYRMSRELDVSELRIEDDTLVVVMRRALRRLPLANSHARRLDRTDVEHLEGLTSLGGFVAGSGGFDSHRLGEFDLYASRLDHSVLVETEDGRVIVTPDDPEDFLQALEGGRKLG